MFEVGTDMTVKPYDLVKAAVFGSSACDSKLKAFQGVHCCRVFLCKDPLLSCKSHMPSSFDYQVLTRIFCLTSMIQAH